MSACKVSQHKSKCQGESRSQEVSVTKPTRLQGMGVVPLLAARHFLLKWACHVSKSGEEELRGGCGLPPLHSPYLLPINNENILLAFLGLRENHLLVSHTWQTKPEGANNYIYYLHTKPAKRKIASAWVCKITFDYVERLRNFKPQDSGCL